MEVQAWGGREGVQAQGEAQLQAPFSLSDAIVLTPADIVIYAGGDTTDSEVVDDDGQVVAGSNLPEPGFFVALPTGLAAKLREQVGSTGLQEGKIDLSGLLEFRRGDEKGWQLEKFDADGYSLARGSFLYRLVPPEEGQDPVQMQFYDGQDYIVASDFDISQALHKEYAMSIYPGEETGSEVKAVVQVEGLTENTYTLGFAPGRLIIRGITGDRDTVAILPPEEAPGEAVAAITAQAPAEVHYYINSSQLQVDDPGAVELLVDSIADSDHHETMKRLRSRCCRPWGRTPGPGTSSGTWTWWTPAWATPGSPPTGRWRSTGPIRRGPGRGTTSPSSTTPAWTGSSTWRTWAPWRWERTTTWRSSPPCSPSRRTAPM